MANTRYKVVLRDRMRNVDTLIEIDSHVGMEEMEHFLSILPDYLPTTMSSYDKIERILAILNLMKISYAIYGDDEFPIVVV